MAFWLAGVSIFSNSAHSSVWALDGPQDILRHEALAQCVGIAAIEIRTRDHRDEVEFRDHEYLVSAAARHEVRGDPPPADLERRQPPQKAELVAFVDPYVWKQGLGYPGLRNDLALPPMPPVAIELSELQEVATP